MGIRGALAAIVSLAAFFGIILMTLALAGEIRGHFVTGNAEQKPFTSVLCSRSPIKNEATFASDMAAANERMHMGMAIAPTGDPDRDFAQMMIPHHQGAIDMALVELKYGRDKTLRRLAQSIIVEQGQEIAYMRALLAAPARDSSERKSFVADQSGGSHESQ